MTICIRDPYFGEDIRGRLAICLHHPTDCRMVSRFSSLARQLFSKMASQSKGVEWLNDANAMFIAGRYHDAIDLCTLALRQFDTSNEVQRGSLMLKRGLCLSCFGAWFSAYSDAREATELMPTSALALKIALSFALRTDDITSALHYGQWLLQLAPGNSMPHQTLQVAQLSEEQFSGNYDFAALLSATRARSTEYTTCFYTGSVKIRGSKLGGRGIFATKEIGAGELIQCERAVAIGVVALMGLAELAFSCGEVVMCRASRACAQDVYGIMYGESQTFKEEHASHKCYKEPAQRCDKSHGEEWQELVKRAQLVEAKVLEWLL